MVEWMQWIIIVVAGLTALGVAFKWIRVAFRTIERMHSLLARTDAVVQRELTPNHGSALVDQVAAIDARTESMDEHFATHIVESSERDQRLRGIEDRIAALEKNRGDSNPGKRDRHA